MRRGTNITQVGLATLDMRLHASQTERPKPQPQPKKESPRRLTDKQRAAIRRYHEAGWSDNAIAIHMGIANQTVYTELSRISGIVGRCPECGGKCYLPCRECGIAKLKRDGALKVAQEIADGSEVIL